jgi:general secretion pathway protein D
MNVVSKRNKHNHNQTRQGFRTARVMLAVSLLLPLTVLAQSITFNLKDAEITTVIGTIAEVTGKNFIIDPRVKGKATVISSRPMKKEEAYQVFLSLLEVHGFSAVEAGQTIKIVPDVNAKQSSTPVASSRRPGVGDETVTRVIDVAHVAAAQLVPILRPLVPQQGHLVAYAPSNVLIISDRAANIQRLVNIIDRVDRPSVDSEIEVVSLEHASAAEVVRILNALVQQEQKDPAQRGVLGSEILIADERTNSVLLGGDQTSRVRLRAIIAHLDTPLESEGNIHVVYLRYAKAKDLVPVLTGLGTSIEQEKEKQQGKVAPKSSLPLNIQADENTNALVITATPDLFRSLQAVIRQLDVRRAQVLVEAVIAEVTSRRASELGVQWLFDGTPSGDRPVGAVNFTAGTSIVDVGAAAAQLDSGSVGSVPIGGGLTVGIGKFNSNTFNFAALVRALEGDQAINVLSTPSLLTLDNVEAEIKVGQVVPFVTGSYSSTGSGSTPTNPFQTVNREDVGIVLKVTPQINEGNAIKMDIEQEISSVSQSETAAGVITDNRSIKTSVLAEDGQTVILGGLISDNVDESVQKVPLLGDLPLLGGLFRYKNQRKEKRNLMVFIKPEILRDAAVTTRSTSGKYDFIRAKQLEVKREGTQMLGNGEIPVLPELQPWTPGPSTDADGADTDNDMSAPGEEDGDVQ